MAVLSRLPITSVAAAMGVCRQWRGVAASPSLWRAACAEAFQQCDPATNERLLRQFHRGSWRDMYLDRCHLRFDGIYVARNTYIKTGAAEWRVRNTVHLVAYYRYFRFLPDGTFNYRTSPETVAKVARSLQAQPSGAPQRSPGLVQHGRWRLDKDRLFTAMAYEMSSSTEVRCRLRVRSTVRGSNNRLDVESIVSYDREQGRAVPLANAATAEEEALAAELEGAERRVHNRGCNTAVFVPFDQVPTSVLNKPVSEMDVFIPG